MNKVFVALILGSLTAVSVCSAKEVKLTYPGKKWSLYLNLDNFKEGETNSNAEAVQYSNSSADDYTNISAFLEKAENKGNSKAVREFYQSKGSDPRIVRSDLKKSEIGDKAIIEHVIHEFQGKKVEQKNYNIYLSKDGVWIDVHLSKVGFTKSDEAHLKKIIDGIKIK